jgi:hypothetical protein
VEPSLYILGLDWLYKRNSGLFSGMSNDAAYLASVSGVRHGRLADGHGARRTDELTGPGHGARRRGRRPPARISHRRDDLTNGVGDEIWLLGVDVLSLAGAITCRAPATSAANSTCGACASRSTASQGNPTDGVPRTARASSPR